MEWISIIYVFKFISAMFCNFDCIRLAPAWLIIPNYFILLNVILHCSCVKIQLILLCWLCILLLHWIHLFVLTDFCIYVIFKMMLWKCCTQYASKFGKLSSGHRPGKGQFSFWSQRKAMPKNAQTTAKLHSSHMLVK